jgi:hypothetical protein
MYGDLSENTVDLSDNYNTLSESYVDLSDTCIMMTNRCQLAALTTRYWNPGYDDYYLTIQHNHLTCRNDI